MRTESILNVSSSEDELLHQPYLFQEVVDHFVDSLGVVKHTIQSIVLLDGTNITCYKEPTSRSTQDITVLIRRPDTSCIELKKMYVSVQEAPIHELRNITSQLLIFVLSSHEIARSGKRGIHLRWIDGRLR